MLCGITRDAWNALVDRFEAIALTATSVVWAAFLAGQVSLWIALLLTLPHLLFVLWPAVRRMRNMIGKKQYIELPSHSKSPDDKLS